MQHAYYDMGGHYFVPSEGVTLASLGVPPYSPPAEDWEDDYPAYSGSADGFGLAEMGPFGATPSAAWTIEAPGGISFDDLVRTIDPRANPDVWPSDAPRYAGWDDAERYAVPYDPRAAALGAVHIPGLPEDATEWGWHDRAPGRVGDAEMPAQLASILERWIGLEMLGADFTPHGRGGYPSIGGGGGGGGGGGRGGGSSGSGRASGTSGSREIPGADAAGEGPTGPILKGHVYRKGGPNPGNLKARPGEDLSARDTFSNPYPPAEGGPVFPRGGKHIEIDAAKLPPGGVYRDNSPRGHVNILRWVPWDVIQKAIKRDKTSR